MLARLLETDTVLHNKTIHTALAHIFCLLIGSLEDINASVAQRASQYLETIKLSSVKVSGKWSRVYLLHEIAEKCFNIIFNTVMMVTFLIIAF